MIVAKKAAMQTRTAGAMAPPSSICARAPGLLPKEDASWARAWAERRACS